MLKKIMFIVVTTSMLSFVSGCGGAASSSSQSSSDPTPTPTPVAPDQVPDDNARVFNVGTGSGDLVVDGNNFVVGGQMITLTNSDIIKIKGGSYNIITIENIAVPISGKPVFVFNDGEVKFENGVKPMILENLNNVIISGQGTTGLSHGFSFKNNSYRAVSMYKPINNFTFRNAQFENIDDYVINFLNNYDYIYDGSSNSYSKNLRFLNLKGNNVTQFITISGGLTNTQRRGLVQNIEVAGLQLTNSPHGGTFVYIGLAEDYNVHNNYLSDINQSTDIHNGIFMLIGNGKFYNNLAQNHQGNLIRAWITSVIKNNTITEIYNNIAYNSRRYSLAEIQVPPDMQGFATHKVGNAKIYNNTAGKMNTEFYSYTGRVLDVYDIGGTIEAYNNLVFENSDNGNDKIFNYVQTLPDVEFNNVYKSTTAEAITNVITYQSLINGVGAVKQNFVVP